MSASGIVRDGTLRNLPAFREFVEDRARRAGLPEDVVFALKLAVDEVCANVIEHGYRGLAPGPIEVEFAHDAECATVTVTDHGRPFDPRDVPAPDTTLAWEGRPVGGLGWHLIRSVIDDVDYAAGPGGNVLRLVKRLRGE